MKSMVFANGSQINARGGFAEVAMCCGFGKHDTRKHVGGTYAGVTFAEIVALAEEPEASDKDAALWLIPSSYRKSDGRAHAAQAERGQYWLLPLDIDHGNQSLELVVATVRELIGPEPTLLAFSSRNSTKDQKNGGCWCPWPSRCRGRIGAIPPRPIMTCWPMFPAG